MGTRVTQVLLSTGITVPCFTRDAPQRRGDRDLPLLLLHAWAESWRSFGPLIDRLPGRLVLAPDLRGHGAADKAVSGYSLAETAEDVAALLAGLGHERADVLGSSSGGYVAQQLARSRPELVRSLILVGAPLSLQGRPAFADAVEALTDPVDETWVRESLEWFRLWHPVPPEYVEDRVRDGLALPAHVWRATLDGLCAAVPPTALGELSAPTLVISGARDDVVPPAEQVELAARIPRSVHLVYDDTGHLVLWECPDRVARDVDRFLVGLTG